MPVDPQLRELKERWLASGEFADEQAYLKGLVELGGADLVFLDPDGSTPPWLAVVVRRETNVVYGTQCAGILCDLRLIEGYLVPLGGWKADIDEGTIRIARSPTCFTRTVVAATAPAERICLPRNSTVCDG